MLFDTINKFYGAEPGEQDREQIRFFLLTKT